MIINANAYGKSSYRMDLIWENEDPTIEFDSTTNLQVNISEYKMIYISFYTSINAPKLCTQIFIPQSSETVLKFDQMGKRYYRVVYNENSYLMFEHSHSYDESSHSMSTPTHDNYIIPYRIYGVY